MPFTKSNPCVCVPIKAIYRTLHIISRKNPPLFTRHLELNQLGSRLGAESS